jgi:LPS-assembly lipoprotein
MWWRRDRAALGFRLIAVMALGGLTAGCFQPLYASRTVSGEGLGTKLAQVQIDRIDAPNGTPEARVAVEIQNALDFELTGGSGLISPTHRIKVRMTTNRSSIITDVTTGRVLSEITGINAAFQVVELATDKVVLESRTFARVSSDYPGQQQRFARQRARLDAEDRAAKVIAENIRTRLASFFVAGT